MATKKGLKSEALSPKVADRLLELLGTDTEFRRLIKKDPQAAFLQAGYKPSKEVAAGTLGAAWMCCDIDRIAPKANIEASREQLKSMLTGGMGQSPIALTLSASPRKLSK